MADDELAEAEDLKDLDKPAEGRRIEVKKEGPPQTAAQLAIRIALGTAGILLLVGFFMPWLNLGELRIGDDMRGTVSGLDLVLSNEAEVVRTLGVHRWIILLIPVLGVALAAVGYLGFRWSGIVGAGIGIVVIGYGVVTVVLLFFRTTAFGIWMILIGTFLAVGIGAFSFIRSRADREKSGDAGLPAEADAE
jgi:amino acid transporter